METSYQKGHPFWNRYSKWLPNLPSNRALGESLSPQSARRFTVPPVNNARFPPAVK